MQSLYSGTGVQLHSVAPQQAREDGAQSRGVRAS